MKIGDKVKLNNRALYREGDIGKIIATILSDSGRTLHQVKFKDNDSCHYLEYKLDIIKPKIETAREKVMF